jgi:hypothetical protein
VETRDRSGPTFPAISCDAALKVANASIMMRYKFRAIVVTLSLIPVWLGVAGSVYYFGWAK